MVMTKFGGEGLSTATPITVSGSSLPAGTGDESGWIVSLGTGCSIVGTTATKAHGSQAAQITYASGGINAAMKSPAMGGQLTGAIDIEVQCSLVPASGAEPIYLQVRDASTNNLYTFKHLVGNKLQLAGATSVSSTVNFDPSTFKNLRFSWVIDPANAANCKVRFAWFATDSDLAIYDSGWITMAPGVLGLGVQFFYAGTSASMNTGATIYVDNCRRDSAQNSLIPAAGSLICLASQDKTTGDTPSTTETITVTTQLGNSNPITLTVVQDYSKLGNFSDTVTTTLSPTVGGGNVFQITPASGSEGTYRHTATAKQNEI